MRISPSKSRRRHVGRVTVYERGRRFWVYYRQGGEVIRRAVGVDRTAALSLAARINAEVAEGSPTSLAFRPVEVVGLIAKWLDHHEQVRRSSLATVRRYRTAIQHLNDFVTSRYGKLRADRFTTGMAEEFVRHLRTIQVTPNGQPATSHEERVQLAVPVRNLTDGNIAGFGELPRRRRERRPLGPVVRSEMFGRQKLQRLFDVGLVGDAGGRA